MEKQPKSVNKSSYKKERSIMRSIAQGKTSNAQIAKRFKCSLSTVDRLFELYKIQKRSKGVSTKIGLGSKKEPYSTEEQSLSSPFYNATNREKITPIRPDWKLY